MVHGDACSPVNLLVMENMVPVTGERQTRKGWRAGGLIPIHPEQVGQVSGGKQTLITVPGILTESQRTPRRS